MKRRRHATAGSWNVWAFAHVAASEPRAREIIGGRVYSAYNKYLAETLAETHLSEDEWLIVIGLDADQVCYVICDKSDMLIRELGL